MDELWAVEFNLSMRDIDSYTPSVDGEIVVRGTDIFDVLEKAKGRLNMFGFDYLVIHGANRCGFEKKGDN